MNVGGSVTSMMKLLTGEISWKDLSSAFLSTNSVLSWYAYVPVFLFYYGFFFLVINILMNVFLAILLGAYGAYIILRPIGHARLGSCQLT